MLRKIIDIAIVVVKLNKKKVKKASGVLRRFYLNISMQCRTQGLLGMKLTVIK